MGDRIVNNSNGSNMAKHRQSRFTDDRRSIREPASQMAEHGEAWTKSHGQRSIWYINPKNLYGYAMMQMLPYKDFKFTTTSLDYI